MNHPYGFVLQILLVIGEWLAGQAMPSWEDMPNLD